jgi:hypothetical protein
MIKNETTKLILMIIGFLILIVVAVATIIRLLG